MQASALRRPAPSRAAAPPPARLSPRHAAYRCCVVVAVRHHGEGALWAVQHPLAVARAVHALTQQVQDLWGGEGQSRWWLWGDLAGVCALRARSASVPPRRHLRPPNGVPRPRPAAGGAWVRPPAPAVRRPTCLRGLLLRSSTRPMWKEGPASRGGASPRQGGRNGGVQAALGGGSTRRGSRCRLAAIQPADLPLPLPLSPAGPSPLNAVRPRQAQHSTPPPKQRPRPAARPPNLKPLCPKLWAAPPGR